VLRVQAASPRREHHTDVLSAPPHVGHAAFLSRRRNPLRRQQRSASEARHRCHAPGLTMRRSTGRTSVRNLQFACSWRDDELTHTARPDKLLPNLPSTVPRCGAKPEVGSSVAATGPMPHFQTCLRKFSQDSFYGGGVGVEVGVRHWVWAAGRGLPANQLVSGVELGPTCRRSPSDFSSARASRPP